jgi:5-methylcytosine-specific restriction endonuclease McrA
MWLIERLDMKSLVTLKDPQRLFPRDWRENKLAEQGFKCAVDGKPLTMENAQGGHIISHADGGRTIYDNLAMISTEHNRKMGSMSLEKYKELLSI